MPSTTSISFNPQASYEARQKTEGNQTYQEGFNPQASYEARPMPGCPCRYTHMRFNPQASYEARPWPEFVQRLYDAFQSTGLIRGPTYAAQTDYGLVTRFQSTGLIRGPTRPGNLLRLFLVSIHRPHTRPDGNVTRDELNYEIVSIHRPHTRPD